MAASRRVPSGERLQGISARLRLAGLVAFAEFDLAAPPAPRFAVRQLARAQGSPPTAAPSDSRPRARLLIAPALLLLWPLVVLHILFERGTASLGFGVAGLLCC